MAVRSSRHKPFGFTDFLWRALAALLLVLATYNPSGFSYFHWLRAAAGDTGLNPSHYFIGILLLIGWVIFIVATRRTLGTLGTVLGAAFLGTGIWYLSFLGIIRAESSSAIVWLALIALSLLLAIGLSWAHVWRRMSGQLEVDDTDD